VENERSGRPVTMKTNENVEIVGSRTRTDRHLGIRMVAEVYMDEETVAQILTTNLRKN
jgi:hypothetical protein